MSDLIPFTPKFNLGQVVITPGADDALQTLERIDMLIRHRRGDWGDVPDEDRVSNDQALVDGDRVISSYRAKDGTKIWIITEWDRSVTTILLPSEY